MKRLFFKSKATLWKSYLIFVVSIVLISIFYFSWMQVQAAAPRVEFSRDKDAVSIAVAVDSGYELKFLSSGGDQYWLYGEVDDANSCHRTGIGTGSSATWNKAKAEANFRVVVTTGTNQYFCVQVLYGLTNNDSSYLEHYALFLVDTIKPTISVSQQSLELVVKATDASDIKTWNYEVYKTEEEDCKGALSKKVAKDQATVTQATITLTAGSNDQYYCISAEDEQGNVGYTSTSIQVDTVAPILTIHQDNKLVTVNVRQDDDNDGTDDGNTDIDATSWQYVILSNTLCKDDIANRYWDDIDDLTTVTINQDKAVVSLTTNDNQRNYCFRVSDKATNFAYAFLKVATINNAPTVSSVRQSQAKVIANGYDSQYLNSNSWQYAITNSDVCDSTVSDWRTRGLSVENVNTYRDTATVDLEEISLNHQRDNTWICLRVADNITTNYGYNNVKIDVKAPVVSLVQTNQILEAKTKSSDKAQSSTWRYVRYIHDFACNETAFEDYTPVRRSYRLSLYSSDVGDYFCFKVADAYDNYGYSETYKVHSLDTTAPVITARQDNHILTLSTTDNNQNVDADTWGYARLTKTRPQACDDGYGYRNLAEQRLTLTEDDVGYWYCIRVADKATNYAYLGVRVKALDATAPVIELTRTNDILTASVVEGDDVDHDTWQYASSQTHDNFDCSADNSRLVFKPASSTNRRVLLTEDDNNRYYCFRVADTTDNYAYLRSQQIVNVNPAPVIKVVQNSVLGRLVVSTEATDVDGLTWGWTVFDYDPGHCHEVSGYTRVSHDDVNSQTSQIVVSNITSGREGSYYCFRVADTSLNYDFNYGYAKHLYDATAPSIKFSLAATTNILTISSSAEVDATSWRFELFDLKPDCQTATLTQTFVGSQQLALSTDHNDLWLCVKVADSNQNYGYNIYYIEGIGVKQAPAIDITQTVDIVIATSASTTLDVDTWGHVLSVNEPYCGIGDGLSYSRAKQVNLNSVSEVYTWICFRVSNQAKQTGYAKLKLDRQAPLIGITQNNVVLIIESSDTDLLEDSWAYIKSRADFKCQANDQRFKDLEVESRKVSIALTATDNNVYYCFQVMDVTGNVGLAKVKITPLDLTAPIITPTHNNTVLEAKAINVQASSWRYARSQADINCSDQGNLSFSTASANNRRLNLTEAANGSWFCFKVTGQNGKVGYAKIFVENIDASLPVVQLAQQGNIIMATANEDVAWSYTVLASATGTCDQADFTTQASITTGNEVSLTATDNQKTYCFRAKDKAQNLGYGKITADVSTSQTPSSGGDGTTPSQPASAGTSGTTTPPATDDDDNTIFIIGGVIVIAIMVVIVALIMTDKKRDKDRFDDDYIQ